MNAKLTSIAFALVAITSSAYAADNGIPGKTRAEVRAELEQAYAQGELNHKEFVEFTNTPSSKTRAEVRAETERAYAQGELNRNGEFITADVTPQVGKTRAEVRAELEQAYARGELNRNGEYVEALNFASTKSRQEVHDEAVRAAQEARSNMPHSGS